MDTVYQTDQRIAHWYRIYRAVRAEMDYQTKRLIADLTASAMILILVALYGANASLSVGIIGLINTVNVTEAVRALRQAQEANRKQASEFQS